jgi:hypothetical protein
MRPGKITRELVFWLQWVCSISVEVAGDFVQVGSEHRSEHNSDAGMELDLVLGMELDLVLGMELDLVLGMELDLVLGMEHDLVLHMEHDLVLRMEHDLVLRMEHDSDMQYCDLEVDMKSGTKPGMEIGLEPPSSFPVFAVGEERR